MTADWIAVDWGTSNLRAWHLGQGRILNQAEAPEGMARLTPPEFEPALLRLIGPWLAEGQVTPALIAGMAGSRQGWVETPYRAVPCKPVDRASLMAVPVQDPRLTVQIVPGLMQARPADVMRGEEVQIAGALALAPKFDGVICLPGTHGKWVHVSAGEVVSFQTQMTGELFDLLSRQSVLRHGIATDGWDDAAFDSALSDALSRPERIGARLFALRAEGLLQGLPPQAARARLSGLLIGMELAAARPYWLGQPVMVVGADATSRAYIRALSAQGLSPAALSATDCTLAGLASLRRKDDP